MLDAAIHEDFALGLITQFRVERMALELRFQDQAREPMLARVLFQRCR